jgi:hypothetical protein
MLLVLYLEYRARVARFGEGLAPMPYGEWFKVMCLEAAYTGKTLSVMFKEKPCF